MAVRLFGLVFLFLALKELPAIVNANELRTSLIALITSSFWLGCSCWLLLGGPLPEMFSSKNLTDLAFHSNWGEDQPVSDGQKATPR